jgi:ubiquinone/menaquinone biosynthesis C-methylase UbiE
MIGAIEQNPALEAFSEQASTFDAIDTANPLIGWVRDRVRRMAMAHMQVGDTLLELNAGTGIDSFHFAANGIHVLATDAATGMIERLKSKQHQEPDLPVEVQECSFLELERVGDRRFDHVFSNFGGLNCTERLDLVLGGIDRVLLPGGTCTLVIMPRFSPWEVGSLLKGNRTLATRRWRRNGTPAQVEGISFTCSYYSPGFVAEKLGGSYTVIAQRALSVIAPPPHAQAFAEHWPRTFRSLAWIEDRIAHLPVIRNWGDHFVITLKKAGS